MYCGNAVCTRCSVSHVINTAGQPLWVDAPPEARTSKRRSLHFVPSSHPPPLRLLHPSVSFLSAGGCRIMECTADH